MGWEVEGGKSEETFPSHDAPSCHVWLFHMYRLLLLFILLSIRLSRVLEIPPPYSDDYLQISATNASDREE